jgi:hypothetical protein
MNCPSTSQTNYKILPIYNSLLIYKSVKETNYQNFKQKRSISIATSIKTMLFSKPDGHQVDKQIDIIKFQFFLLMNFYTMYEEDNKHIIT